MPITSFRFQPPINNPKDDLIILSIGESQEMQDALQKEVKKITDKGGDVICYSLSDFGRLILLMNQIIHEQQQRFILVLLEVNTEEQLNQLADTHSQLLHCANQANQKKESKNVYCE